MMEQKLDVIRKAYLVDRLLEELAEEREVRDDALVRQVQEIGKQWRHTCHVISAHVVGVGASVSGAGKRSRKRESKAASDPSQQPAEVQSDPGAVQPEEQAHETESSEAMPES